MSLGIKDLKEDNLVIAPATSNIQISITDSPNMDIIKENKQVIQPSSSSVLGDSDPLMEKQESHSAIVKIFTLAKRYKITLAQAYRMALNTAERAKQQQILNAEKEEIL
jgi:hypothetical protein